MSDEKKEANKGKNNKKHEGNKFTIEAGSNQDKFEKTLEHIGDKHGEKGKEYRDLIVNTVELVLEEPAEPTGEPNQYQVKRYEMELNRYFDKKEEYEKMKGIIFIGFRKYMTLSVINKLESLEDYDEKLLENDVLWLVEQLRNLTMNKTEVKHNYWTTMIALKQAVNVSQFENESLVGYYKRFNNGIKVIENSWGKLCPIRIASKEENYLTNKTRIDKETRDKFVACMFLNGANRKYYGRCVDGLNNDYLAGNKHYPETVEKALEYLQNYHDGNQFVKNKGKKNDDGKTGAAFGQLSNVTCHKCGEKGHCASSCECDNDDEKVINNRKARKKGANNVQLNENNVRTGVQLFDIGVRFQ